MHMRRLNSANIKAAIEWKPTKDVQRDDGWNKVRLVKVRDIII